METGNATGIVRMSIAVEHRVPLGDQLGHQPQTLPGQFGGDGFHAHLLHQFQGGLQTVEPQKIVRTGLVASGSLVKDQVVLSEIIWALQIVPAVNHRTDLWPSLLADVQESRCARSQ